MGNLTSRLTVSLKDDVSGPAKGVAAAMKGVGASAKDLEKLGKIDAFRATQKSFGDARASFNAAQVSVKNLAREMAAADAPSRKLQASYTAAQRAAKSSAEAFRQQATAIKASMASLNGAGVPISRLTAEENRLRAAIERTTAAATKRNNAVIPRERALNRMGNAVGAVAAPVATAVTAQRAKEFGKKAVVSAAEFDIGVRQQRAFAGISEDEQKAKLIPQAKKIGQDTPFTNLDIVRAQTAIMQRLPEQLPRADVAHAITEEVKNYALSMKADMTTSAEGITAFLMQTGKDISTQDKAVTEARKASNMLIRMAKLGGMSEEDVSQYMKYAATSSSLAGLSNETLGALGVGLKRAGFRGDEAGVAIRSISSKLVSPGRKGMDALTAMGVDYNQFTTMPGGLSAENLEAMQKRRFGKTFSDDQRGRLDEVMNNPEVLEDKDEFISQVSAIVAESFGKKKDGTSKAQDQQKIAKLAADFHQLGTAGVDAEGLLAAILQASPTLQQLNALFTDKQGGKAGALGKAFGQVGKDREALLNTPSDFGKKIADLIMGGLGGDLERAKGSIENFTLAVGNAVEGLSRLALKAGGDALDKASELPEKVLGYGAGIIGAGGALASGLVTQSVLARFGVVNAGTGAGAAAGGMAIGAAVGLALSDISKDFIKANPDFAAALTGNSMLGAMNSDAALAAGILQPGSTPGRYGKAGNRSRAGSTERDGAWIPGHGPDVFTTGAKPIEGMQMAGPAGAAGKAAGSAFTAGISGELDEAVSLVRSKVEEMKSMLNFNASPSITPKFGPAPSVGKGAALDAAASKHAAFSDGNGANFGTT